MELSGKSNRAYQQCPKCHKFIYHKVKRIHWSCNYSKHRFSWSKENLVISESDLQHLLEIHLRNPDEGYQTNSELAEMYGLPPEVIDDFVSRMIHGKDEND
jgi:hypothetical protein